MTCPAYPTASTPTNHDLSSADILPTVPGASRPRSRSLTRCLAVSLSLQSLRRFAQNLRLEHSAEDNDHPNRIANGANTNSPNQFLWGRPPRHKIAPRPHPRMDKPARAQQQFESGDPLGRCRATGKLLGDHRRLPRAVEA